MAKATGVGVGGWQRRQGYLPTAVMRAAAFGLVAAAVAAAPPAATAQAPVADGAFTTDQAASGWSVYGVQCGDCHGPNLEGMVHAPPLSGVEFLTSWVGADD